MYFINPIPVIHCSFYTTNMCYYDDDDDDYSYSLLYNEWLVLLNTHWIGINEIEWILFNSIESHLEHNERLFVCLFACCVFYQ